MLDTGPVLAWISGQVFGLRFGVWSEWGHGYLQSQRGLLLGSAPRVVACVKGHRDFPVGGRLVSVLADI